MGLIQTSRLTSLRLFLQHDIQMSTAGVDSFLQYSNSQQIIHRRNLGREALCRHSTHKAVEAIRELIESQIEKELD